MDKKRALIATIALVLLAIAAASALMLQPKDKPTFADELDFAQSDWVEQLVTSSIPLYQNDFAINAAYVYSKDSDKLVFTYATQADIPELREYYEKALEGAVQTGVNDEGNLSIEGSAGGKAVAVCNYYSEVANVVEVVLDYEDEGGELRAKLKDSYPKSALDGSEIGKFAAQELERGYVLYDFDEYATEHYPKLPIFSRAYAFDGSMDQLKGEIESAAALYADKNAVLVSDGQIDVKENGHIISSSAIELPEIGIATAIAIQKLPE